MHFYWPTVMVVSICFLATLYHVSVPVRTNWSFNLPGAVFSLLAWIAGSYLLRWVLTVTAADSKSIYGPLAAPIAVLIWLYIVAIAVLIGAAVNAAFDTVFPQSITSSARVERSSDCAGSARATARDGAGDRGARRPWCRRLDSRPCQTTSTCPQAAPAGRSPFQNGCARRGGS